MQWHWGNIGSAVAGLSTLMIAAAALIRGPAALRAWLERLHAETEVKREEAETIRLERRRGLSGWSRGMVAVYKADVVEDEAELERAAEELASGLPTEYVVLRVREGADSLRRIIGQSGYIARRPTAGELEALEKGLDLMGIQRSGREVSPSSTPPAPR